MSVKVNYKGEEILSANTDTTKTLKTSGKYCEADIEVINAQDGGITPSGNINITDTNPTDVTNYATATVVDAGLVASNIKEGVNILGILGTFAGGGSLPTSISKIDGGSFTPSSDTTGSSYPIAHNLGIIPKCYAIWTDDNDAFEASANNTLIHAFGYLGDAYRTATTKDGGYRAHYTRNANGSTATFASYFNSNEKSSYATATAIYWGSANKYKAGCTYKWVAWA